MNWRKIGKIVLAIVIYLFLTYGVLDALVHWWAHVASPIPDAVSLGFLGLFTAGYVWLVWRVLRKQARPTQSGHSQ